MGTAKSGSSAYVSFGMESTFQTAVSRTKLFGKKQEVSGLEYSNGAEALPQLYSREMNEFLYGRNHGQMSVDYILSNPFIFNWVFGTPTTGAPVASLYTHTWDSSASALKNCPSGTLEFWTDGKSAGVDRVALGAICTSLNIKTAVEQPVSVTQSIEWGKENTSSATMGTPPTETVFKPYSFANVCIKLPSSGSVIASVQEVSLNIETGCKLVYGVGCSTDGTSANATDAYAGVFNFTGKLTGIIKDKTNFDSVVARTDLVDLEINITNGISGGSSTERSIKITIAGIALPKHTFDKIAAGELITESLDYIGKNCIVVAKNASAS